MQSQSHAAESQSPRAPSEFRYWENLEKPLVRRARKASRLLLGFDPAPAEDRVHEFAASFFDADPLAENFVREVVEPLGYARARQLLDEALEKGAGAVADAPESLLQLFADLDSDPDWLDWQTLELGARVFRRYGSAVFKFAGAITLQAYVENSVAKALILAGGYEGKTTRKRFMETASFWIDVSEAGALGRGKRGRAAALRVRIMHVFVRRRLREHPEWDLEAWGAPISQGDAVMTLMGGSIAPGLAMQAMGYRPSRDEILAMMHFWRYVGHLMGVRPRWYPSTIREALQLTFVNFVKGAHGAGVDGKRLCQSYARAFAPAQEMGLRERIGARLSYRKHLGYTRFFLPPWSYRANHLPPAGLWALHPLAQFPFIFAAETLRRRFPPLEGVADRVASRQRKRWFDRHRAGARAGFRPAETLSR